MSNYHLYRVVDEWNLPHGQILAVMEDGALPPPSEMFISEVPGDMEDICGALNTIIEETKGNINLEKVRLVRVIQTNCVESLILASMNDIQRSVSARRALLN
jgi:hypothetical protein